MYFFFPSSGCIWLFGKSRKQNFFGLSPTAVNGLGLAGFGLTGVRRISATRTPASAGWFATRQSRQTATALVRNEVGRWWRSRVPRRRHGCHLLFQANGGGAGLPATLLLSMAAIVVLCCVTMCRTIGLRSFEEDDD
nr:hypothetical protein Iba_chr07bCG9370 [Ipomoea batatas]